MELTIEENYRLRFGGELIVSNHTLALPITDSEKLLMIKIEDACRFNQKFKYSMIKNICESIGWEKSKGERVYKKLRKLKLITKNDEINSKTLFEFTIETIIKRRE